MILTRDFDDNEIPLEIDDIMDTFDTKADKTITYTKQEVEELLRRQKEELMQLFSKKKYVHKVNLQENNGEFVVLFPPLFSENNTPISTFNELIQLLKYNGRQGNIGMVIRKEPARNLLHTSPCLLETNDVGDRIYLAGVNGNNPLSPLRNHQITPGMITGLFSYVYEF